MKELKWAVLIGFAFGIAGIALGIRPYTPTYWFVVGAGGITSGLRSYIARRRAAR